jgi:heparosan-N-sulfate-glucuronate 5-epimerase
MRRRTLHGVILTFFIFLVYSLMPEFVHAQTIPQKFTTDVNLREPHVFFDKPAYSPNLEVFWNKTASVVPIRITVTDRLVGSRFVKVRIFSSVEAKKVTLMKVDKGRFECCILAHCLCSGELAINANQVLNVRYGDEIVAKYKGQIQAVALIAFPRYVLGNCLESPAVWTLFDSEGVPLVNYGYPIGVQYNPVTVSQCALANYHMYLATGNSSFRTTFLIQADWLVKNAAYKGNFSVWEYKFDWKTYVCISPWVSGMAQGQCISVLTRAYFLTSNITYLDIAQSALNSFEIEMSAGGVRYIDPYGSVWYEEYADVNAPSSKVLNGFIFALLGLYEYTFATNSSHSYALFLQGVQTLAANVHRYDTGSWSCYDLLYRSRISLAYHQIHVNQLMTLYYLTGERIFREYSDKFNSYIH